MLRIAYLKTITSADASTITYKRIFVICGLLLIIFFIINLPYFTLVPQPYNILSEYLCKIIDVIPSHIIKCCYILLVFFMIYSIYTTKYLQVLTFLSLILFEHGMVIIINSFSLENISSFLLFKVNYEIPLYFKQYFFQLEYNNYLSKVSSEILQSPKDYHLLQASLNESLTNTPPNLHKMNGANISHYLRDIFNDCTSKLQKVNPDPISTTTFQDTLNPIIPFIIIFFGITIALLVTGLPGSIDDSYWPDMNR